MRLKHFIRKLFLQEFVIVCFIFTLCIIIYTNHIQKSIGLGGWIYHGLKDKNNYNLEFQSNSRIKNICSNENNADAIFKLDNDSVVSLGMVRNKQDKYIRDIGYKHHAFNALTSNNIGIYREIPDSRHKVCPRDFQNDLMQLPTVSVIICFYNEHKMTLMRSINSVIKRTPKNILTEIILVDDFSDLPELEFHLISELNENLKYKNLHFIRNTQREGLIRSRTFGAREASGQVLVFLDSHIEVNQQWSEPLLELIKKENHTLAVPVIDLINPDTFEYKASPLVRGGFNWGLHFTWENLPKDTLKTDIDFKGPFKTPTMAGGIFAINREYFHYIGEYDMGMDIWGGENLEISFRVWQCGGAIKIVPCSRVGHVFRKRRPYTTQIDVNSMLKNSLRLAYVWMDEYKEYYLSKDNMKRTFDFGDISDRLKLRKQLKCQNFSWYLKNVFPELHLPGEVDKVLNSELPKFQPWQLRKRNYVNSFLIKLSGTNLCASIITKKVNGLWKKGSPLVLKPCLKSKNQIWFETEKSEIILDKLLCLEASENINLSVNKCHEMLGNQEWRHIKSNNSPIYNMASGTCLSSADATDESSVGLDLCSNNAFTKWDIVILTKF